MFFAIKDAIKSARVDAGFSPEFTLEVPATCAQIRMACEDHITEQVLCIIANNWYKFSIIVQINVHVTDVYCTD